VIFVSVGLADDIPPPRPVPIAALVGQLGSDSFAERETATRRLAALDLDIVPKELSQALKSDEPEVRKRAAVVVEVIRNRSVERVIGPGRAFARRGDVSLFVAATAKWNLPADNPRVWDAPFEVVTELMNRARTGGWNPPASTPWRDRTSYFKNRVPETVLTAGRYAPSIKLVAGRKTTQYPQVVVASEYDGPTVSWSIVTSRKVTVKENISSSALYCNEDLKPVTGILNALVVCDGDVQARNVYDAIVIARGNIRVTSVLSGALLIAGGEITCDLPDATHARSRNTFKPREPNPLGFVKFFELSRVGLEVADADKVVRIKSAADAKAFVLVGAKVGDVVEGVNGAKPESAESLRRLLRDALAVGDATVTVRRGDATHTLKITLPE
jgi:hypothetical protein